MKAQSRKWLLIHVFVGILVGYVSVSSVEAVNISEFVTFKPYVEIGGGYDDNLFELPDGGQLPQDAENREDSYLDARAGVKADIHFEESLLNIDLNLLYEFSYLKYSENSEFDETQNNFDFDFSFGSEYEEGFFKDRMKFNVADVLSFIPIDEDEPMFVGNQTWKNEFNAGVEYNVISKPRTAFILGYSYGRDDYGDEDIDVWTVDQQYQKSSELTQDSQTHTGTVDLKHAINSKLTTVLSYAYEFSLREENLGELQSANFSRQDAEIGVEAKLTPRINSNIRVGYSLTSYDDVDGLGQDDQDSIVGEISLTGKFEQLTLSPLMSVGYQRYYDENDFGDTLLVDDIFGRIAFKIADGYIVTLSADYTLEERALYDDESNNLILGVDGEFEVVKNMRLLAGYSYGNHQYFSYEFLDTRNNAEDTTQTFSAGLEYKVARYVLLRGMYHYTDQSSDSPTDEYTKNEFVASGRVIF